MKAFEIWTRFILIFLPHDASPLVVHGFQIIEASRSHSDAPHSVGRTSDQPDAETSTWQQTDIHDSDGIRTHNPSTRVAHTHVLDRTATGIVSSC